MRAGPFRSPVFWMRVLTLGVVASVGLALSHLTWRLIGWDDGSNTIATPARLAPVGGGTSGSVASILALAPFGGASAVAAGLPTSSLGLVLKGVIYSAVPSESSALIGMGEGLAQTYGVGQSPIGNAVIEAIEIDRVVLNVGGHREVLTFPTTSVGIAPTSTTGPSPAPASVGVVAAPTTSAPTEVANPAGRAPAGDAGPSLQGPDSRQGSANLGPALNGTGVSATSDGYRLGPDAPQQLLRAGLRPGDLIRTVNGRAVGDATTDSQLFERATAAGSARVELVRDGRTLTLTFPLR